MKIAFDHQVFGLQKHGGISRYFSELVRHLAQRRDVSLEVIAPFHINEYLHRLSVREYVSGQKFPFDFRGNARIVKALNTVLLPAYWRGGKFDIIHETYYSSKEHGRARVRVLTIYDMIHELFPEDFPNSAQVSAAKRAASLRADHVICISETTRRDAIRVLGIPPERCSVVYLGCSLDSSTFPAGKRNIFSPCILYVGPRSGYKNFRVLLEAFSRSPLLKSQYYLIAFGGRGLSSDEESEIGKLGLTGRVKQVTGNDELLGEYYNKAAAFVYPSRYEGFGIPPLEAMSAGCPVVCSNAGSISEVVGDAGAYFEPDDSTTLHSLLERLTKDREFADQLRARGFLKIKEYSWKNCAEATFDTYKRLLGEAPSAPSGLE
jgi:glycosyltransferase involved in cell wall biosynthesis